MLKQKLLMWWRRLPISYIGHINIWIWISRKNEFRELWGAWACNGGLNFQKIRRRMSHAVDIKIT